MNRFLKLATIAIVALSMWACVDNANTNKPANSNANANANANASTAKAPPTLDAIMAQEKQANEAYAKGDGQFFQGFLSDKFVMTEGGQQQNKADAVKMISGSKCDVKSMSLDEGKLSQIDADNYAVVYKATWDGTCTMGGKTDKIPSPVRGATVWTRSGDKWQPIWHGETQIVDPKANPPKAMPPAPAAKSENPAANSNANTNTAAAAKPTPDAAIDAMAAVEKAGWEAWRTKDASKFQSLTTSNLAFVDLFGNYTGTQADTIKVWTTGSCDIKSTSVTDTSGVMFTPTFGVLFFRASGDGTCEGMKVMPVKGTSFYVKDGDTWKLAFGFESPA